MLCAELVPMEPLLKTTIPLGSPWLYQVKWDGIRILSCYDGHNLTFRTKKGNLRQTEYPELYDLTAHVRGDCWILDGEVVCLGNDNDRTPDFFSVLKRDRTQSPGPSLLKKYPVTYQIFDLLLLDDGDLSTRTLLDRLSRLKDICCESETIRLVSSTQAGISLFEQTRNVNHEGIVAKKKSSPYKPGKKHTSWVKIKHLKTLYALVGGVIIDRQRLRSLLLGLIDSKGRFIYIGKASTGLSDKEREQLVSVAKNHLKQSSPFLYLPQSLHHQASEGTLDIIFLPPQLAVQVTYAEWTPDGNLRHPVINGFVDRSQVDCSVNQSHFKPST